MTYQKELLRAHEINAYHNIGCYIFGGQLHETDRGWKNEEREATEAEIDMWNILATLTPETIDAFKVDNPETLQDCPHAENSVNRIFWLRGADRSCLWAIRPTAVPLYQWNDYTLRYTHYR